MIGMSRWCMTHRRWVILAWLAIAVGTSVIAFAVGRNYSQDFTLPGTQSQHVADLLTSQFKAQSGDVDTIVFHYSKGRYDAPAVARHRSQRTVAPRSRRSTTPSEPTCCRRRPVSRCSTRSRRSMSQA